jgi:hypothetical protein
MSTMLFAAEKVNQTNLFPKKQISDDMLSTQRHLEVFRAP